MKVIANHEFPGFLELQKDNTSVLYDPTNHPVAIRFDSGFELVSNTSGNKTNSWTISESPAHVPEEMIHFVLNNL